MALSIKDEETDRLARELAELTGQPLTTAIREAIAERLAVLRRRDAVVDRPDLTDIIARGRARDVRDTRDEAEILGFGDDGLPV